MIFFFNANGDLLKGNPDTVYQGSSNAGKIYAVAPLNPRLIADIYFTLPNGDEAGPYLLTKGGTVIEGKELPDGYALWFINLNSNLTQFAGDLTAQIGFYATEDMTATADGIAQKVPVITTQAFNIVISRGVARTLPAEPTNDVYEQIVNTLTLLSQDISKISGIYPPASIKDIGEAVVTYSTDDGVTLKTTEQWMGTDGETFDIETERELPIKGGKNIAIDVTEDGKFIEVKSTADPIEQDEKGKPGGVPTLDSNGQIPSSQLPTYVDDVIDGYVVGSTPFAADWLSKTPNGAPLTPERDKIYIVVSEGEYINIEYRWSGTVYAELGRTTPLSNTTGQGTNIGMTQKAITDELAKKQGELAIYTVNTATEVTIPADDLARIKADPNAIIVEVDSARPSVETRVYRKGIDFLGGTIFVSIYTVSEEQVAEGCLIAYRGLDTSTGVLSARHETNATSLKEVRQEIEGKYLPKPSENPTEDSLVKVSSTGSTSYQPVSDFLALPTSVVLSDRVCIIPDGQTKFDYKKAYKSVYEAENVFVIRDTRGTVPQPDPQRGQDGVNLRYLQANYNGNPTLEGTEAELTGVTLNGVKYKVPSGGGSSAGIDTLTDVDLNASGTTVAYDIASGVTINSNGKFTYEGGEKEATTKVNVPIVAGKGVVIAKVADKEQVEVKLPDNINITNKYVGIGNTEKAYNYSIAIGAAAYASAENSVAIGGKVSYHDSVAIGREANVYAVYSVAILGRISTGDSYSVAIGYNTSAGSSAVALGTSAASWANSVAVGSQAKSNAKNSLTFGPWTEVNNNYQSAIGQALTIPQTQAVKGAFLMGCYGELPADAIFALADGTDSNNKHIYYKITKETIDDVAKYTAYLDNKKLLTEDEGLSKPSGNPTEDSVVKVSSAGTVSYLGIDTTATSASANLVTSGAVAAVKYSLSQSIAGCATEPDISTFPENDDAFFIGEKTSHASKWLPKKQMTLKSHKIHFDAFDSGSTVGQYDDAFISVLCYTETPFTVETLTTFMLATGQSYPVCSPSYGMVGYVRVSNAAGEITWEDKEGNNIALAGINESSYVVTDIQSFFPFE